MLLYNIISHCLLQNLRLDSLYPNLANLETHLSAYAAHRSNKLQIPKQMIEIIDTKPDPPIRPPPTKLRPFVIRSPVPAKMAPSSVAKQAGRTVSITSSIMKPTVKPAGAMQPQLSSLVPQGGLIRTAVTSESRGLYKINLCIVRWL